MTSPLPVTQFAKPNLSYYGALANGSHDDTPNIQAAINENVAVGGRVEGEPGKVYEITDELVIDGAMTLGGGGISDIWGGLDDAESRIIMCEIPTKAPYLKGTIFRQNTAGKNAIKITAKSESVHLRDFGILFADSIRFSNTGHGIHCLPPVNPTDDPRQEFGIFSSRWDNVMVWGHDGNHYAFKVVNPAYGTFTHLRSYGGGGLEMYSNCAMYSPGNCVIDHPYFALFAGGTSHGIYLHSVDELGGKMILNTMIRPQVNALNGPAAWSLTPLDEVNQYRWYADNTALKTTLVSPDFENYLVNCPTTLSANMGLDGFRLVYTAAGGTGGERMPNMENGADQTVFYGADGYPYGGIYPTYHLIKDTVTNAYYKIKVTNGVLGVEAL